MMGFAMLFASLKSRRANRFVRSSRTGYERRRKKSRPLRPTSPSETRCPCLSTMNWAAARMTFALKPPASPLSAVMTSNRMCAPGARSSRAASRGCVAASTRPARLESTRTIDFENGRAAMMRSCALRRREAAIIFMAFVICCVDLTARIRRRMSIREGITHRAYGLRRSRVGQHYAAAFFASSTSLTNSFRSSCSRAFIPSSRTFFSTISGSTPGWRASTKR